jgi:hypothetical protein
MDEALYRRLKVLIGHLGTTEDLAGVAELLRLRLGQLTKEGARQFRCGERVRWLYRGLWHTGTVVRPDRKSVAVREDGPAALWRLSPRALTLVAEAPGQSHHDSSLCACG